MSLLTAPAWEVEAERRIESFESAWQRDGAPDLAEFLPSADDPVYLPLLCELIRIDMELRWSQGSPRMLHEYLEQFPQLRAEPDSLQQVAFEEHRQRVQAGDTAGAEEYRDHFGVNIDGWPSILLRRNNSSVDPLFHLTEEAPVDQSKEPCNPPTRLSDSIQPAGPTPFPRPGDDFAEFRILGELGRGAFGRVFLAEQLDLARRRVALKVSTELHGESQKLAQLQHTNIMPIYSAHKVGSLQVVCMPYYGATTLAQVILGLRASAGRMPTSGRYLLSTLFAQTDTRRDSQESELSTEPGQKSGIRRSADVTPLPFPAPTAKSVNELEQLARMTHVDASLWIAARVADGLAHAHSRNILHRDLKPANVLLTDEGQPMLLDFNLAIQQGAPSFEKMRHGGTLPYMAPEQLDAIKGRKQLPDARSDQYALGVILYELLTGKHPFSQPSGAVREVVDRMLAERDRPPPDPRRCNPHVTPAVAAIVRKMLAPKPEQRYPTSADLREDLDRQLANLPLKHAPDVSPRERIAKFRRRHPRLWTGSLISMAGALLFLLPLTLLGLKQAELEHSRREKERYDAVVLMHDSLNLASAAQSDLLSRNESSIVRDKGVRRMESLAQRYRIDVNGQWLQQPQVQRLNDQERRSLLSNLGQAFWVMAESKRQHLDDIRRRPSDEEAGFWRQLAEHCLEQSGRPPFALEGRRPEIGAVVDLSKYDNADLYSLASEAVTLGQYESGGLYLKELTQRDPSNFMAWFMRGICHENLRQDESAVVAWTACIALQPTFANAYFHRGTSLMRLRQYSDACVDFVVTKRLEPENFHARISSAICAIELKKFDEAEQELTEVLKSENPPTRAWFVRAKARRKLGRHLWAALDEQIGFRTEPTDDLGYSTRGWARIDTDPAGALADFDAALKLNPRSRTALQNKVHVLTNKFNRHHEAIEVATRLIEYYPFDARASATRAVIYARIGDATSADRDAKRAYDLDRTDSANVYQVGSVYAALSKDHPTAKQEALRFLGRSVGLGLSDSKIFREDRDLDPIRDDLEFQRIAKTAQSLDGLKRITIR